QNSGVSGAGEQHAVTGKVRRHPKTCHGAGRLVDQGGVPGAPVITAEADAAPCVAGDQQSTGQCQSGRAQLARHAKRPPMPDISLPEAGGGCQPYLAGRAQGNTKHGTPPSDRAAAPPWMAHRACWRGHGSMFRSGWRLSTTTSVDRIIAAALAAARRTALVTSAPSRMPAVSISTITSPIAS